MQWMIYGANGYTGELIAREAQARGLRPVLAGRSPRKIEALARELGLESRVFDLANVDASANQLAGISVVLHCAGPFSATSAPMLEACLMSKTHYLDISGEIAVFEHAQALNSRAQQQGIVICPGVGFDVIPTDCVAAALKAALPDATQLALGFDSRSGFSPGTAKTSVEGLAQGGRVRRNGKIVQVPLAFKTRKIDFGDGEKLAGFARGHIGADKVDGPIDVDFSEGFEAEGRPGAGVFEVPAQLLGLGHVQVIVFVFALEA